MVLISQLNHTNWQSGIRHRMVIFEMHFNIKTCTTLEWRGEKEACQANGVRKQADVVIQSLTK